MPELEHIIRHYILSKSSVVICVKSHEIPSKIFVSIVSTSSLFVWIYVTNVPILARQAELCHLPSILSVVPLIEFSCRGYFIPFSSLSCLRRINYSAIVVRLYRLSFPVRDHVGFQSIIGLACPVIRIPLSTFMQNLLLPAIKYFFTAILSISCKVGAIYLIHEFGIKFDACCESQAACQEYTQFLEHLWLSYVKIKIITLQILLCLNN